MLLHPPCEDLHLSFHVCNAPELPACSLTVDDAVQVPVNGTGFAEFNKRFSYGTDLLDPCGLARVARSCRTLSLTGSLAVAVRALGNTCPGPTAADSLLLVRLDNPFTDESPKVLTRDCVLDIGEAFGIEPDTVYPALEDRSCDALLARDVTQSSSPLIW
jgi:hypothetical protein